MTNYLLAPNPKDTRLTENVRGVDQAGSQIRTTVTVERPLTVFLNDQEIVTIMTIGDYPECLAIGFLLNQNIFLDRSKCINLANKNKMFICAV